MARPHFGMVIGLIDDIGFLSGAGVSRPASAPASPHSEKTSAGSSLLTLRGLRSYSAAAFSP
jgi:hypothetical protein